MTAEELLISILTKAEPYKRGNTWLFDAVVEDFTPEEDALLSAIGRGEVVSSAQRIRDEVRDKLGWEELTDARIDYIVESVARSNAFRVAAILRTQANMRRY